LRHVVIFVSAIGLCHGIVFQTGNAYARVSLSDMLVRIESLETQVADLEAENGAQQAEIDELKAKLASVSVDGDRVVFEGVNVQIVNGTGTTDGTPNTLGNLIVGYNELRDYGNDRRGSHNIVVGQRHRYSSNGGLVAGYQNTIS